MEYKHKAVILKDGLLQVQVNLESEPDKQYFKNVFWNRKDYMLWQSKNEYFHFASKEDEYEFERYNEHACIDDFDCIEIRDGKVYFKAQNEVVESHFIRTYSEEEMIQCYKDAINNAGKIIEGDSKPFITAEQYLESINAK